MDMKYITDKVTVGSVVPQLPKTWMEIRSWAVAYQRGIPCSAYRSPSKQPLEQQVLGPYNTVDRLVWCVADSTHRVGFGSLLRPALKALGLATDVDRRLRPCQTHW